MFTILPSLSDSSGPTPRLTPLGRGQVGHPLRASPQSWSSEGFATNTKRTTRGKAAPPNFPDLVEYSTRSTNEVVARRPQERPGTVRGWQGERAGGIRLQGVALQGGRGECLAQVAIVRARRSRWHLLQRRTSLGRRTELTRQQQFLLHIQPCTVCILKNPGPVHRHYFL